MSTEENKALTRRFIDEAINGRNLDLLDEIVAEDFVEHEVFPGLPTRGPEAPRAALGMFIQSFPDFQMQADSMIAEDDKVVVQGTMTGTNNGEFMGMPATNKSVKVNYIDVIQFRDGQAIAHWGMTDQVAMMTQLGMMPEM